MIVNFISLDNSHGANGPYNTFFRNRVEKYGMSDESRCVDESYVGNDVDGTISVSSGTGEFLYGNVKSTGITPSGYSNLNDRSYYLGTNVTQAPPVPPGIPIAFTAVVVSLEDRDGSGLVIRQRALPNREPFADAQVAFSDPAVATLGFRYMDESGNWQDTWDAEIATPRVVAITVGTSFHGRTESLPPLTVALRATTAEP